LVEFDRRDELLTIKPRGISENIRKYAERQSGERSISKFIKQGFITTLFANFPTVVGSTLRGIVYRAILGKVGSLCFLEKNVRFNAPQRIFFGDRVIVGEGTTLSGGVREKDGNISEIRLGNDVRLSRYCVLKAGPGNITLGKNVCIGQFSWLDGTGGLEIGEYAAVASHVVIMSTNHNYQDRSSLISFQGKTHEKVVIGRDAWLGTHVVVLPGVTIGNGSVISAGAVVTKDIPEYSIAVGVPASVIGKRK
jgi:acetyltransferase-like isoleucine patch superfamily enzyme